MSKPTLCVDFDGVIHRYSEGWKDGSIYDTMTDGFIVWAAEAREHFELVIYSSRSKTDLGRGQMVDWMIEQLNHEQAVVPPVTVDDFEFAHEKPPAFLTIDDRAIRFDGDWSRLDPQTLLRFKPWTARTKRESVIRMIRKDFKDSGVHDELDRLTDLISELVEDQPLRPDLAKKAEEALAPYKLPLE